MEIGIGRTRYTKPATGQVRVKVEACGICHSDTLVKEYLAGASIPASAGNEIAGRIDAIGADITQWKATVWVSAGTADTIWSVIDAGAEILPCA